MEEIVRSIIQQMDAEKEERYAENPIPMEIATELENLSQQQLQDNFKHFKRDTKRYHSDEWTVPEKINKSLLPYLKRHQTEIAQVVATSQKITEATRFQARVAMEIFEELQLLLERNPEPMQARRAMERLIEQSKRLAICGLATAKTQEREAKTFADKALHLPPSLKHLETNDEDIKGKNAYSEDFLTSFHKATFEQRLLQQASGKQRGREVMEISKEGIAEVAEVVEEDHEALSLGRAPQTDGAIRITTATTPKPTSNPTTTTFPTTNNQQLITLQHSQRWNSSRGQVTIFSSTMAENHITHLATINNTRRLPNTIIIQTSPLENTINEIESGGTERSERSRYQILKCGDNRSFTHSSNRLPFKLFYYPRKNQTQTDIRLSTNQQIHPVPPFQDGRGPGLERHYRAGRFHLHTGFDGRLCGYAHSSELQKVFDFPES